MNDIPFLDMPEPVSRIDAQLSIGEFPNGLFPINADVTVNLDWEPHTAGKLRVHLPFHDGETLPDVTLLRSIAAAINGWCEAGLTVYVHCRAGLNRSGLVCALVLMQRGMSANDAIALLRAKRDPAVLCNTTFVRFLQGL